MKSRTDLIREATVKRGIEMAREKGYLAASGMMMKAGLSYPTIIRVLFSANKRRDDLDLDD